MQMVQSGEGGRWRQRLMSVEMAALAGILCALGWSIGITGLLGSPSIDASPQQIVDFYSDTSAGDTVLLLMQVQVMSTIAFLWFVGVVRNRLGDAEPKMFGTVFLGGAILLAAIMLVGAAALAAPSVLVEIGGQLPDPQSVSLMRAFAVTLLAIIAPRVSTLVMFSTAALGRTTGVLPRWLVWLTYTVGIAEFINFTLATPTIYIFPLWIALVSVVFLIRRGGQPPLLSPRSR